MVSCEAMTPGEIKAQGKGVTVHYGVALTPFGDALFAWTQRGVCKLAFCDGFGRTDSSVLVDNLATEWSAATLQRDEEEAVRLSQRIFYAEPAKAGQAPQKLHLLLRGTNFQIKVWEALLNIGSSKIVSYSTLAKLAGSSKAQRAVGSALAANRIAYLIPCHRVIRENGDVGVYRWGSNRKAMMLAWEKAIDDTRSIAE
jgi:AraC family transcriptional regulator of adaptative response/methylated-DNA-[protein]-cysteine methyltransferase